VVGNNSEGGATDYLWSNGPWINAGRFFAGADAIATTMFAKVGAIPGRYQCAIYSDNAGVPGALLRAAGEISGPPADGWYAFPLTSAVTLTSGGPYWFAIWSDSSAARVYHSGTGGTIRWGARAYGEWPPTLATSGGADLQYCIYVTNTAPPAAISSSNLPSAKLGLNYSFAVTATNGVAPYTWTLVPNTTTPSWLTLSTDGVLSGVPAAAGQYLLFATATDAMGEVISGALELVAEPLVLALAIPPQSAEEIQGLGLRLALSANEPGTYLIQRTRDFQVWEELAAVAYTNGVVEVLDEETEVTCGLYRVARQ
jgi:hypothetical protein